MSQLLKVQDSCVSLDGFGAGEHQSLDRPFGHADPGVLFAWAGATGRTAPTLAGAAAWTTTAARGQDVRLGGGATTIRQFLDADLVDTMHVVVSPVQLGSGVRLWESPDEPADRFHVEVVPSPSGVGAPVLAG